MTRIVNLSARHAPALAEFLSHEGHTAVWFNSTSRGPALEVLTDAPRAAIDAAHEALGLVSL